MKTSFLWAALLLTASAVASDGVDREGKFCRTISNMATEIMKARQNGVPMADVMELVPNPSPIAKLGKSLVISAYERRRYSSAEMRQESVVDFANEVYLSCVKD